MTRESYLRDGIVEARITHLHLETRLVGSARLVLVERPSAVLGTGPSTINPHLRTDTTGGSIQAPHAWITT
jgi:hypothetical protein